MRILMNSGRAIAATLASLTLLLVLAGPPLVRAEEHAAGMANNDAASTEAYWTSERLTNVQPMPVPKTSFVPEATAPESAPLPF